MNILKLRGKIVEKGINVETLANNINIDRATLYRKLNDGERFTIGEALRIKDVLNLSVEEACSIFLE